MATATTSMTADRNNNGRRRRRSRRSHDAGDNSHDPYCTSLPLQAMKRLRVDADTNISTAQNDTEVSLVNDVAISLSLSYTDDIHMRTTPEIPTTTATTTNFTSYEQEDDKCKHDSYHCYQRHQHQETGQDSDGWSSPEQVLCVQPLPTDDRRRQHHCTNGTASLQLHDNHSSFGRRNSYTTPTVLRNTNEIGRAHV